MAIEGLYREKEKEEQEQDSFDAGFTIPETKSVVERLKQEGLQLLQSEHKFETEEREKKGQAKKQKPKKGTICFCMVPHCSIGPFVERE